MAGPGRDKGDVDAEIRRYLDDLRKNSARTPDGAPTNLLDGLVAPAAVAAMLAFFVWQTALAFALGFAGGLVVFVLLRVLAEVRETVRLVKQTLPDAAKLADLWSRMGH